MLRRTLAACVLACLLAPGSALADCVVPPGTPDDAGIDRLVGALPLCQRDPEYLAALGHVLNLRGRYAEAADHLERSLMLAPELKGARLDYAIALAGIGEVDSARLLVDEMLADPTLPPPARTALERQRRTWASATDWHTRVLLAGRVGHDSNLLGAPDLTALTLTFPTQSVVLPLDESSRPKAGSYQRIDFQVDSRRQTLAGGQIEALVALRSRRSGAVAEASSHQADAVLDYNNYVRRNNGTGFYTSAATSILRAGSGIQYNAFGIAGGLGSARWLSGCDSRIGVEIQNRKYLNNDLLSGRYSGISGSVSCQRAETQWLVSAKGGTDHASHAERAGGDQTQYALRGALVLGSVGPGRFAKGRVWLDLELGWSTDRSGYSPLLDSGRSRAVRRRSGRLEYQYPLSDSLQWMLGAEWVTQHSNLPIFANRSWGPYLALRHAW